MTTDASVSPADHGRDLGLAPPFPKDQLQRDIALVLWTIAQQAHLLFGRDDDGATSRALWKVAGEPPDGDASLLGQPDLGPEDIGLSWERVSRTAFAETMEALYDYAYFGLYVPGYYPHEFQDETHAMWIGMILGDQRGSDFTSMWQEFSGNLEVAAFNRCYQVCETASARLILEGSEESFLQGVTPGQLTIRQMSLLSGMTEASLRTLANPKRPNALKTQNRGSGTYVDIVDAKRWLTEKGRYLPLHPKPRAHHSIDLERQRFPTPDQLILALDAHFEQMLCSNRADSLKGRLRKIRRDLLITVHATPNPRDLLNIKREVLEDGALVVRIGEALGLPGRLLALRAAESLAMERLNGLEALIRQEIPSQS